MKKYKETDIEVSIAKMIAERQFADQNNGILNYEKAIVFDVYDTCITNPFLDDEGKESLTLDEAYALYGELQMDRFIYLCSYNLYLSLKEKYEF